MERAALETIHQWPAQCGTMFGQQVDRFADQIRSPRIGPAELEKPCFDLGMQFDVPHQINISKAYMPWVATHHNRPGRCQSTETSARVWRALIRVIAQPAAAKPAAAAAAITASRHADWVSAVPPRCPTSAPYVAQPAAAAAS